MIISLYFITASLLESLPIDDLDVHVISDEFVSKAINLYKSEIIIGY